tara:strand:- start:638 stop:1276 length:639 start_codon:yes stop_codon:yes gene_type:complete
MFKTLLKTLKSNTGNSLAEFAVTTAMMATLAATAAPQFGSVGEGAKEKKTMNNIDKIIQSANNFYNQKLDEEGRGRFPGQSKYDSKVGGYDLPADTETDIALEIFTETILNNYDGYTDDLSSFVYVFAQSADDQDAIQGDWHSLESSVVYDVDGAVDFVGLFANNGMASPFQDGAYIYLVIPGSGSGSSSQAPALIVADAENPTELHKTLVP